MTSPAPLPRPFLPLGSPAAALESVGGKGANLARLERAGFPVPNGFFIPTEVYRAFVDENKLDLAIHAALEHLDEDDPAALEAASQRIRTRFGQASVPATLGDALEIAWRWLGAPPVAVRSSATAEDLPDLSFAGQQDTYLNIIGADALEKAVVDCWSSLWTARAIGYRARNGIDQREVSLAVVVQEMVPAEASGVLFTANPLTGKRSETVIDATLGLGEALVSGLVEPDHYLVSLQATSGVEAIAPPKTEIAPPAARPRSDRLVITKKTLGAKATIIRGQSSGGVSTEHAASNSGYAHQQALPDKAILQLAEMGREIAALYGFPQDIEWAYIPPSPPSPLPQGEGGFYILQSRPITSLFPLPENLPAAPLRTMIGFHVVQGVMEPITPLGRDVVISILLGGGRVFGLEPNLETQLAILSAGERLWINVTGIIRHPFGRKVYPTGIKSIDPAVSQIFQELLNDPRLAPVKPKFSLKTTWRTLRFVVPFWGRIFKIWRHPERERTRVLQLLDDEVARAQAQAAVRGEMWASFARRVELLHNAETLFSDMVIPQGIPPIVAGMAPFFGILQRFSAKAAQAANDPALSHLYLEITRGLPHNVTTEMDLALWRTAQTLQADHASAALFESVDAGELTARYLNGVLPPAAQQAVGAFMNKYGMRGLGEIDIGRPRWREEPTHIMQVLQSYMTIKDAAQAPDTVFARGAEAAQEAASRLERAVRGMSGGRLKSRLVRWAIKRYRALAGMREAPKFFAIRMMGITRQGLLESGQALVDAGLLEKPDDLFFLYLRELDEIAARRTVPAETRETIRERRAARAREMRRKQLPRVLLSDGTAYYEGMRAASGDAEAIVGDPVSPGVVEGTVRVVLNPHETKLEHGEILVCPGTDPAWTPLFLAAGGLVMEVGGMMTHGSVVAREYGIPAVVGVHQATTRLETGQKIRVNGSTGEITIL
ncbi:MAG: phosphoenolpyruvate synthase [Chloroflexi bacterium]|nr:phosphoenolpyruvate synthase [Chloroflexota bacterium]